MSRETVDPAGTLLSDAPLGEVTLDADTLQVVFRRHCRASPEKVWATLTLPERRADWFAEAQVDLRVGGILRLNGKVMRVAICDPPHVLAWSWPIAGRESLVRFELAPEAGGCTLTLTHSGVARASAGVRAGWHAILEALPDAIEGRATTQTVKAARESQLAAFYPALPD